MTLRTLNYGNYGILLIMGHAGFCPSAESSQVTLHIACAHAHVPLWSGSQAPEVASKLSAKTPYAPTLNALVQIDKATKCAPRQSIDEDRSKL